MHALRDSSTIGGKGNPGSRKTFLAAVAIIAILLIAVAGGLLAGTQSHPNLTPTETATTTVVLVSTTRSTITTFVTQSQTTIVASTILTTATIITTLQTSETSTITSTVTTTTTSTTTTTTSTIEPACPSPPVSTLPLAGSNFSQLRAVYSNSSTSPLGYVHNGFDLIPLNDLDSIVAPVNGTIVEDIFWQNPKTGNWQVNVGIDAECGGVSIEMAFEPMSLNQQDGLRENATVLVHLGQTVLAGQRIASLLKLNDGSHVHFGVNLNGKAVCPVPYVTQDVLDILETHLHTDEPNGTALCYP